MTTCWLPVQVSVDSGETVSEPVTAPLRTGKSPDTLTSTVSRFGTPLTGLPFLVKHCERTLALPVRVKFAEVAVFPSPAAFHETVRLLPETVAVGPLM